MGLNTISHKFVYPMSPDSAIVIPAEKFNIGYLLMNVQGVPTIVLVHGTGIVYICGDGNKISISRDGQTGIVTLKNISSSAISCGYIAIGF